MTKMEQAVSSSFISRSSKSRQFSRDSLYTSADMLKNSDKILNSWVNKPVFEEENRESLYSEAVEDEAQRLSLDSGFGPDVENDDDNEDDKEQLEAIGSECESNNVSDREGGADLTSSLTSSTLEESMGQRKLQSILRAEPQVFVVRCDKKVVKKKKSKVHVPEESLPRKRVEFLLENEPLSLKTKERNKKRHSMPIRHARRTFGHLKRKITGRNTSKIPLLPSIHSTHTLRHQGKHLTKGHATPKTKVLSSPVLGRRTRQLFQASSKQELEDNDDDDDYKTEEDDEEVEEISSHEQEEEEEEDVPEEDVVETDHNGNDESDDIEDAKKEENKVDDDEDDDYPKISRRKALSYHLRAIHLQQNQGHNNNNNKRKCKKVKPKFLTSGHGPGHAHHIYPKPLTNSPQPTVASNDAKNDSKKKKNKKGLTFKYLNKKINQVARPSSPSVVATAATSVDDKETTANDNDIVDTKAGTNEDDILLTRVGLDTANGQQKSSSQPKLLSLDFNQKFVGGLTRMLRANSEPKVQRRNSTPILPRSGPGRIVNTRYRSDFPCDDFPRFDF